MDKCANCSRDIGNLETPMVFNDAIVCAECHSRLSTHNRTTEPRAAGRRVKVYAVAICLMVAISIPLGWGTYRWMTPEPTYNGKPLSEWIHLVDDTNIDVKNGAITVLTKMPTRGDARVLKVLRDNVWHPDAFKALWEKDREFARTYAARRLVGDPERVAYFSTRFQYLGDPDPSWLPTLEKVREELAGKPDKDFVLKSLDETIVWLKVYRRTPNPD